MQAQASTGLGQDVNILEAMEMFKSVPDQVLTKYVQDPKLAIFAAAEMARRDDMRKRYQQRAQKPNKPVVSQLAESLAPSMPMMPPGMNAPQEQQQMQMAPSQMQPQMQEPQQPGLASLMPQQSFAGGGPVAFQFGGLLADPRSGIYPKDSQEELKRRQLAEIEERLKNPNLPGQASAILAAEAQKLRQEIKPAEPAKPAEQQKPQDQTRQPLVIPPQQAQTAPAPMGLGQIIKTGKDAMSQLGIQQIQVPEAYETSNRADQLYKDRQGRFPDEISPIMQQLKDFYGKQPTQEDIQKAANRQIALSMMGSKERNFLAGLAGGLQAGEDVKKSMGAENRAAQQASLQAQLAHAKYQDAIRRGDYDTADKAAREERTYNLQVQKLRQEQAMMPLEMGIAALRAQPKPAAGEKPINPLQASKEAREIYEMPQVQAEIKAIEDKYVKMAAPRFGLFGGTGIGGDIPENWRAPGPIDEKTGKRKPSLGDQMRAEQEAVLRRYAQMFGFPGRAGVFTPSNEQIQDYARRGAQ